MSKEKDSRTSPSKSKQSPARPPARGGNRDFNESYSPGGGVKGRVTTTSTGPKGPKGGKK